MSRIFFGAILGVIGLLYLVLAYQAVQPSVAGNDWVGYVGALLFLVTGVGAAVAAVNLVRAKRH